MSTARTEQFAGLLPEEVLALPTVEVPIDGVTGFALLVRATIDAQQPCGKTSFPKKN